MRARFEDARKFVTGELPLMVATENAGRGVDWVDVDHVVHFELPRNSMSWLHRSGRTGRAGRPGRVTCFVGAKDKVLAQSIRACVEQDLDLHRVFSRRQSFQRRRRRKAGEAEDADAPLSEPDAAPLQDLPIASIAKPRPRRGKASLVGTVASFVCLTWNVSYMYIACCLTFTTLKKIRFYMSDTQNLANVNVSANLHVLIF